MLCMDTSKIRSFLIYLVAVGIGLGAAKLGFDFMTVKFSPGNPAVMPKAYNKPSNTFGYKAKVETTQVIAPVVPAGQPSPSQTPAAPKEGSPAAAPLVKEKKTDSASYLLTGVYLSGNKAFALVNNQIVEEGDDVAGAKVFKINLDEVILKLGDGQAVKLTTRSRYP